MPRGGYQKPTGAQAASGPGKFSKRTDAQRVETPKLAGSDLQYGDVQRLRAAQKVAPLPQGVERPALSKNRQPTGSSLAKGGLPSYLFEEPTALPDTPETSGLTTGPGPGPEILDSAEPPGDLAELVMQRIWETTGRPEAAQWLIDRRNEKAGQTQAVMLTPEAPPTGQEAPSGV